MSAFTRSDANVHSRSLSPRRHPRGPGSKPPVSSRRRIGVRQVATRHRPRCHPLPGQDRMASSATVRPCAPSPSSPDNQARSRSPTCPSHPRTRGPSWSRPGRSASAAPTWRSSTVTTGGHRPGRNGSSSGTSRWAPGGQGLPRGPHSPPGTWSLASCAGPTPSPARPCAAGNWDMCTNGQYTERGIKARHGYGLRAVPHPSRVPGRGGPRARVLLGVLLRTGYRRRQGLGPHRKDRPPGPPGPPRRYSSPAPVPSGCLPPCCQFSAATTPTGLTW